MKVLFTTAFLKKLESFGKEKWFPRMKEIQRKLEPLSMKELLEKDDLIKIPNLQKNMYVMRLENLRLFVLIDHGEYVREETLAFLDVKRKTSKNAW